MRLNLGAGSDKEPGYIRVDSSVDYAPDVVAELPALPFQPGSVTHILASHIVEHLVYEDGQKLLEACYQTLRPGGTILVRVPDTLAIMKAYVMGMRPPPTRMIPLAVDQNWDLTNLNVICHLFLYSTIQSTPHKWSYDEETLAAMMGRAGFEWMKTGQRREWWEVCLWGRRDDPGIPADAGWQKVRWKTNPVHVS